MTEIDHENRQPSSNSDASTNERRLDWLAEHRNRLNIATQETRFNILQKIIGHPKQLPTLKELDYFMLDVSSSTIRNHLETLVDAGLVARVTLPEDQRTRDNPHVFYGLTEEGRAALKDANLLKAEEVAQEATLSVDVPRDVKGYMQAPRPKWKPANVYDPETKD